MWSHLDHGLQGFNLGCLGPQVHQVGVVTAALEEDLVMGVVVLVDPGNVGLKFCRLCNTRFSCIFVTDFRFFGAVSAGEMKETKLKEKEVKKKKEKEVSSKTTNETKFLVTPSL